MCCRLTVTSLAPQCSPCVSAFGPLFSLTPRQSAPTQNTICYKCKYKYKLECKYEYNYKSHTNAIPTRANTQTQWDRNTMKYVQSIILTTTNFGAGSPNIHNHYLLFTAAKKCLLFLRPNRISHISHDPQLKLHILHFFKCKNAVLTSPVEIDNNHIAI